LGHNWILHFDPDGYDEGSKNKDYISVQIELVSKGAEARASCDLRLVDLTTGMPSSVYKTGPRMF
jgi:speckle-type POZ protein